MKFTESYNITKVGYIIDNADELLPNLYSKCKNEKDLSTEITKCKNFFKYILLNDGTIQATYKYSPYQSGEYGRQFVDIGIQNISRDIRGFLLEEDKKTDIDMVNCHPCIIKYLCDKFKINRTEMLDDYIHNRNEIFQKEFEGMVKEDIKTLILTSTNSAKKMKTDNNWLKQYDLEIKRIQKTLSDLKEFEMMKNDAKLRKDVNINGSAMNRICCHYENLIIKDAMYWVIENWNVGVFSYMFDGFIVNDDVYDKNINDLNKYIQEKWNTDLFKFDFKTIENEKNIHVPIGYEFDLEEWKKMNAIIKDDKHGTEVFLSHFKHIYKEIKGDKEWLWIFDPDSGMYRRGNATSKNSTLTKIIGYYEQYLNTETSNYARNKRLLSDMIEFIPTCCKSISESERETMRNNTLFKILFKNGIFDFKTNTFKEQFDPSLFFVFQLPYDFKPYSTELNDMVNELNQTFFIDPFKSEVKDASGSVSSTKEGDYIKKALARAIAGDISSKRIYMGLGDTNNGKSLLVSMMNYVFCDYVGMFNGENLCFRQSSNDEATKYRWALLNKDKRLMFASEFADEKNLLNGDMMKKLSSGGKDKVQGRTHGKEEEEFIIHFTMYLLLNDMPDINPFDDAVKDRCQGIVNYNYKFVSNVQDEMYEKKIKNLDHIFSQDYRYAFFHLLNNAFQDFMKNGNVEPEEVIQFRNETTEDMDINVIISDNFTITEDENDKILNDDLKEFINEKKIKLSLKKLRYILIKRKAVIYKNNNVRGLRFVKMVI